MKTKVMSYKERKEREIVKLLKDGYTIIQIGHIFRISPKKVEQIIAKIDKMA